MKSHLDHPISPLCVALFLVVIFALVGTGRCQSVQNGQAQPLQMTEHPQHAAPHVLGTEQSLLGNDAVLYARGERPMSDFYSEPKRETPLGDIARYYRDHKYVPKEDDNGK